MTHPTRRREDQRFLGNTSKTEVHDLQNEDKSPNGCQIDEMLRAGHGVRFVPDQLDQARREGYDPCAKCIGGSSR